MLNYRKKAIIAQVIQDMSAKIYFTESEIEELYNLSVECKNNFLSQDESITKINNLKSNDSIDIVAAPGVISG